jgi:hypothetical protein
VPVPRAPVLVPRPLSEVKAKELYPGFLGSTLKREHRSGLGAPIYARVSRAQAVLHLSEHFGGGTLGATAPLPVQGIAALQTGLLAKPYPYARPGLQEVPSERW